VQSGRQAKVALEQRARAPKQGQNVGFPQSPVV
jgi:hypothetical protein